MTHSYVWQDSVICVTWLIHMCDRTHSYVWHDSFIYVTWLIHMCDMTHSYVWHDSFITWGRAARANLVAFALIRNFLQSRSDLWNTSAVDMTNSCVWLDPFMCVTWLFMCVTWLIHMCDMTHSKDSICAWRVKRLYMCVTCPIHMRDMTHSYVSQVLFAHVTRYYSHMWHNVTLQHTAAHCNTLQQHTATSYSHMWHVVS